MNNIKNKIKGYLQSEFLVNVFAIFSGSAIAQLVPLAIEPFLTRLYTPEEFGVLALYVSFSSLFTIIATGRYELAVILPKTDRKSINVVALSIGIAICVGILSVLVVLIFNNQIATLFNNEKIRIYLYIVPISVWVIGFTQTFNYWAIRKKRFKIVSFSRITQTISNSGLNLGVGFFKFGAWGLILSFVFGQILGFIPLLKTFKNKDFKLRKLISKKEIKIVSKEYSDFPKINSLHAFSDILQQSLLIFLISYFFSESILGYYSRTFRILAAPVSLIGASIGQVFMQKASSMYANGESIRPLVIKVIKNLGILSIAGFSIIFFFGEDIFAYVFSEKYREAGIYAQYIAPWMMMIFVVSPISSIPLVLGKQKQVFLISIIGNSIILLSIIYAGTVAHDIKKGLMLISIFEVIYYLFFIVWILKISKKIKN